MALKRRCSIRKVVKILVSSLCLSSVPTAKYKSFTKDNIVEGSAFIDSLTLYVLKADGLAAWEKSIDIGGCSRSNLVKYDLNTKFVMQVIWL